MLDPRANYYELRRNGSTVASGSWGYAELDDIHIYREFNDEGVNVPPGKVLLRVFHRIVKPEHEGCDLVVKVATTTDPWQSCFVNLRRLSAAEVVDASLSNNPDYPVFEASRQ